MSELSRFQKYITDLIPSPPAVEGVDTSDVTMHMVRMLCRTQSMFKWSGLPDTIPQRNLELYLQINGNVCFYKHNDNLYAFTGGMGGEPDVYYMPTIYTISNPALKLSVNARINDDCIVIPNDSMYTGLIPMLTEFATNLAITEKSLYLANINSRVLTLISACDDRTALSAEQYIKDLRAGKVAVIGETPFLEGIKSSPFLTTTHYQLIHALIELEQYYRATWYNDIGLNSNYNMKKGHLTADEIELNADCLLPLVDDMLEQRRAGAERVNAMFGTNISVELNSSWLYEKKERELSLEVLSSELDSNTENSGQPENENAIVSTPYHSSEAGEENEASPEGPETTSDEPVEEEPSTEVNIEVNINSDDAESGQPENEEEEVNDNENN